MSINQHQFEQLTEMGISLWQRRISDTGSNAESNQQTTQEYSEINLAELKELQLFNDILLATGLSIGEIKHQGNHIDFNLFNWYFVSEPSSTEILWQDHQLTTPSLTCISKSPILKKQLWHILSTHAQ